MEHYIVYIVLLTVVVLLATIGTIIVELYGKVL